MNKSDLVQVISREVGITNKDAGAAIDAFMGAVKNGLKKGEHISLVGFGSWEVKARAKRQGVNPQTGKKITIPARKVVKFNPGKDLKEKVKLLSALCKSS